jgi:hypothetical protein
MSQQNDEIERVRRIRDRQLQLRDPKARERKVQRKAAARYKPQKLSVAEAVQEIPGKWLGTIVGGLLGVVLGIVFDLLVASDDWWMRYVPYLIAFAGLALGRMLGAILDWQEDDHDALVRHR